MSFMTKIKAKYILRLASRLDKQDPILAQELKMLVAGAMNNPHPRPQITLGSINSALSIVVDKLNQDGIEYALAGGLATKYWVDIRETLDVDLIIQTEDIVKIKKLFPNGKDLPLMYTVRIEGTDIDFLKGDLFPWAKEALKTASEQTDLGIKINIIKPEYLILFKLRAARDRDVTDIKGLLSLKGISDKSRLLVNKYMTDELDDLDQLIKEVEFGV